MPEARATARYIRVSPRKARRVIDLIRGRDLREARAALRLAPSPTARTILKVLNSAAANAETNHDMDQDFLWVSRCYVDGGPSMRRMRIGSIGRGGVIRRRMSHITVILEEREELREAAREAARRRRRRRAPAGEARPSRAARGKAEPAPKAPAAAEPEAPAAAEQAPEEVRPPAEEEAKRAQAEAEMDAEAEESAEDSTEAAESAEPAEGEGEES
jgi:large subunit ribosomal protein L22